MKGVDFKNQQKEMYSAEDLEEEKEQVKAQIETIQQYNSMLQKLKVNENVLNANIHELFLFFNMAFFNNTLDSVILEWSARMTLCAGICYYDNGLCTIRLSKQLLKYRSEKELQETLIHEMIHAFLFLTKRGYDRDGTDGHGKDFQQKMHEINGIMGLKITVYHTFHDEVDSYRQHVWLCNGPCRKKPPFYGIVKRAKNMPPSEFDDWWGRHQKTCGGVFKKIAEPEGYKMKQPKKNKEQPQSVKDDDVNKINANNKMVDGNIDNFFKKVVVNKAPVQDQKQTGLDQTTLTQKVSDQTQKDNKRTRDEAGIVDIMNQNDTKKRKTNDENNNYDIEILSLVGPIGSCENDNIAFDDEDFDLDHLDDNMVKHVEEHLKFDKVTKVQKAVIPLFLSNKDVCVKACTGSGKTLAFGIPLIQQLLKIKAKNEEKYARNEVVGLILAPSRELAIQISKVIESFQDLVPEFSFCYFIGGNKLDYDLQRIKEKGCNIVVATVGRLFDLYQKQSISFRKLEVLIMDEADKLLECGYEVQLNHILNALPKQRRTGLFSATMTSQLKKLIKLGMRNPHFVEVRLENQGIFASKGKDEGIVIQEFDLNQDKEELKKQIKEISEIPSNLENFYQVVEHQALKLPQMMAFLNSIKPSRLIIFFGTCASVDFHSIILKLLMKDKAIFFKLHGKIDQKKRGKIYNEFKNQDDQLEHHQVLLTTDLAARGIDIPDVDWIIQFDPPQDSDQFVHRIGRTARAGRSGKSLIYLMKHEDSYAEFLTKKKVQMVEQQTISKAPEMQTIKDQIQSEMKQDRDLIDKASNAFVSFVRYYKEHTLNFIFAMNLLDIGQVANSFFLFRVPRVKEILNKSLKGFQQDNSVKIEEVPYKDKNKMKQKEGMIKKRQEKLEWKEKKKEVQVKQESQQRNLSKSQKKRRKNDNDWNEWEELQKEENLFKKLKKGKISQKDYDKLVYDSDFDDLSCE